MSMLVPVPASVGGSGPGSRRKCAVRIEHTDHGSEVGRGRGRAAMGWQVIEAGQDGKKMRRDGSGPRVGIGVGCKGGALPRECCGSLGKFLGCRVDAVRRDTSVEKELNALGARWEGDLGGGAKLGEGGRGSHRLDQSMIRGGSSLGREDGLVNMTRTSSQKRK
jgi:hypothetical protein